MTQCSYINQTKVQNHCDYQSCIELFSNRHIFEILTNIILQALEALRTTNSLAKVGQDIEAISSSSSSTSSGLDKHR
jgi:hypothetical protein